jgi:hypothetical protein
MIEEGEQTRINLTVFLLTMDLNGSQTVQPAPLQLILEMVSCYCHCTDHHFDSALQFEVYCAFLSVKDIPPLSATLCFTSHITCLI